jgi:hypothetical protein
MLIEIAMQGLSSPKYGDSVVMHPLMFLSHVAWNRHTLSPGYLEGRYQVEVAKFAISRRKLRKELISDDWGAVLQRLIEYKTVRFPDDHRVITLCAFTPQSTLRVEWTE